MNKNLSIFNDAIRLDIFCYDIVEAWIEYCESNSIPFTDIEFVDWIDNEFLPAMSSAYDDVIADMGRIVN